MIEDESLLKRMVVHGDLKHVAITADGNGRWATNRGLPRTAGHEESQKAFLSTLKACVELDVPYLSLHVFSSENWARPAEEVNAISALFAHVLRGSVSLFDDLGVRFRWAGSVDRMPGDLLSLLRETEERTLGNDGLMLQFCLNYGGRLEIAEAVAHLCDAIEAGQESRQDLDVNAIRRYLYTPDIPDVDLYIRTAGEKRFSNFLIWQAAYAELVFTDTLWPDFRRGDLVAAVKEFASRRRTFGTGR
ncbi:polyprenyl diphosphate synthase [Amycolatopsis sp. NPDC051128]|uniref:polyprenyl diphosphate synthase n=1 Tax=Amycolatopsis sp. NPDC051128 TaxID=3155412 RepID=UPI00342CED8B